MNKSAIEQFDVVVIGGGPAGLAAAMASNDNGAKTLVVERESRVGGILKQCIHDGFGLVTFNEKLTGPEYAERYMRQVKNRGIRVSILTYVTDIIRRGNFFSVFLVNSLNGVVEIRATALVLATGCRERTAKQAFITGTRPAGIYTAGTAQYFVNMMGYLPCKKCVVLGSGDIGLIMARRLTLEGAEVAGVFEAKGTPSGLTRNIVQCLEDFNIPLKLSHTVTKVFGENRVEAVAISEVDAQMKPVAGTERIIECDGVILSVGLIPENELAEALEVQLDKFTRGPVVNDRLMTNVPGVFSCGNALHVNDLVDYVTESGLQAGREAARFSTEVERVDEDRQEEIDMVVDRNDFLYVVPQKISKRTKDRTVVYFRSRNEETDVRVNLVCNDRIIYSKKYAKLKPPEMERLEMDLSNVFSVEKDLVEIRLTMSRS